MVLWGGPKKKKEKKRKRKKKRKKGKKEKRKKGKKEKRKKGKKEKRKKEKKKKRKKEKKKKRKKEKKKKRKKEKRKKGKERKEKKARRKEAKAKARKKAIVLVLSIFYISFLAIIRERERENLRGKVQQTQTPAFLVKERKEGSKITCRGEVSGQGIGIHENKTKICLKKERVCSLLLQSQIKSQKLIIIHSSTERERDTHIFFLINH